MLVNDQDSDGDTLSLTNAVASSGEVQINEDGTLTFMPASGFSGEVTVNYTVSDGELHSDGLLIISVGQAPVSSVPPQNPTTPDNNSSSAGSLNWYILALLSLLCLRRARLQIKFFSNY